MVKENEQKTILQVKNDPVLRFKPLSSSIFESVTDMFSDGGKKRACKIQRLENCLKITGHSLCITTMVDWA